MRCGLEVSNAQLNQQHLDGDSGQLQRLHEVALHRGIVRCIPSGQQPAFLDANIRPSSPWVDNSGTRNMQRRTNSINVQATGHVCHLFVVITGLPTAESNKLVPSRPSLRNIERGIDAPSVLVKCKWTLTLAWQTYPLHCQSAGGYCRLLASRTTFLVSCHFGNTCV